MREGQRNLQLFPENIDVQIDALYHNKGNLWLINTIQRERYRFPKENFKAFEIYEAIINMAPKVLLKKDNTTLFDSMNTLVVREVSGIVEIQSLKGEFVDILEVLTPKQKRT